MLLLNALTRGTAPFQLMLMLLMPTTATFKTTSSGPDVSLSLVRRENMLKSLQALSEVMQVLFNAKVSHSWPLIIFPMQGSSYSHVPNFL